MATVPELIPNDEHNQTLISNVHPADWKNPEPASSYHMVVIGAGTAGLVSAAGAATLGAKVALIERDLMGGDCLNVGCVPSKALIRSSRALFDISKAGSFGIRVPAVEADGHFPAVMERLRRLRAGISHHDSVERFSKLGVDIFLGEGRFDGPDVIEVEGTRLRFKKAVIATGARAAVPPVEGLKEAGYLTNETVFNLTRQPRRLAVLGGGPIGLELAQAFCRLGSEVSVIEMLPQFLPKEDPDAAELVERAMRNDGVQFFLGSQLVKVSVDSRGKVLQIKEGERETKIIVDEILVAVGRTPNVESLNLEAAGVKAGRQGVEVDDRLRTSNSSVFAAGDVAMQHKFTHAADAAARIVIQNALFLGRKKLSSLTVPWCTYTSPEIAHVGLYEEEAKQRGIEVQTFKISLSEVDRAVLDGEDEGFAKIHVQKGSDKILGATVVAEHAGDMISEITLAMVGKIGLGTIGNVIHPYPTQAEVIRKAADSYNRTRLTPFVQKLLRTWLKWTG